MSKPFVFLAILSFVPTAFAQTAWQNGVFHADTQAVIGRSDIVLARPNLDRTEAMPLGNGRLGVAVWSADGFTAQLNRNDTFPDRLCSGQVVLPGLAALTHAADYSGRVDLYKEEFRERGGGMTAKAYVQQSSDTLVIEVTGATPDQPQTAVLKLWSPRAAKASTNGPSGLLAESWLDDQHPGASHRAFGSLSAITADAREVAAAVTDPTTITVTFKPHPDGHFRILAAVPHFDGKGEPQTIAAKALIPEAASAHLAWWQAYWNRAALVKITAAGAGEYMENLRALYLYVAAIEKGYEFPGSQAGVADMISSSRDIHKWDPSAFWHFNLRMQVAANLSAGLPELNAPYFHLYTAGLADIEDWTFQHMNHRPGVCVPETMRFNGPGYEYEGAWTPPSTANNCDSGFRPYYNARTLSTGAEVSLWAWRQYLATNDREFLSVEYPLMAAAARFLLAYQKAGPSLSSPDGLLHTSPSNAHENQWDVTDPITDLSAIQALYPAIIEAAQLLHKDPALVDQLKAALPKTPPFPRTQSSGKLSLLPPSADADNTDVLASSYEPQAEIHNIENLGLEPVWPYSLIGDTSPLFALARRTYEHRPNRNAVDWSFDPLQAARLGLGAEVASTLIEMTKKYQGFPNGMSKWSPEGEEFYVEESGIVAAALPEAVVQDYDGLLRIAPALPPGWDVDARLPVHSKTWVDLQTRAGTVTTLIIEAGANQRIKLRNPWPSQSVDVLSTKTGKPVLASSSAAVLEFPAIGGARYEVQPHGSAKAAFAPITGTPATTPKQLGAVAIGLFPRDTK